MPCQRGFARFDLTCRRMLKDILLGLLSTMRSGLTPQIAAQEEAPGSRRDLKIGNSWRTRQWVKLDQMAPLAIAGSCADRKACR
jgi:hypothetical protein